MKKLIILLILLSPSMAYAGGSLNSDSTSIKLTFGDGDVSFKGALSAGANSTEFVVSSAGSMTAGSVPDARLTANIALKNVDNAFSTDQSITGSLSVDSGSLMTANSANVASVATTTLPLGNVFHITGVVAITTLNICDAANNGRFVLLIFDSTASLADGNNLKINGVLNGGLDDTISLVCDGTNWFELSRQAN